MTIENPDAAWAKQLLRSVALRATAARVLDPEAFTKEDLAGIYRARWKPRRVIKREMRKRVR